MEGPETQEVQQIQEEQDQPTPTQPQFAQDPNAQQQIAMTGNQSNSQNNMQQPMSKLLQINQGQFEDYLVMALNDSLMKKSKLHYSKIFALLTSFTYTKQMISSA